ncbi:uncharacterized protein [Pocillopora verrucosa]|uniref:uncharacterized protein n=1 Tax=Pocillopora verrucosa TaxID=203993 RepID=UPI0033400545
MAGDNPNDLEMGKSELELTERNRKTNEDNQESHAEVSHHQKDFLEDELDEEFWIEVRQKQSEGFSWSVAMSEVRIKRMIQKYKDNGELDSEDPALLMLKTWPASGKYKDNPDRLPGLEQLINQLLEILLESELNFRNRYQMFRDRGQKSRKTLMHYAAELGFLHVTKTLVKKCPGLLAVMTREPYREKQGLLPVELALLTQNDDLAAYLIQLMSHNRFLSKGWHNVQIAYKIFEKRADGCYGGTQ